MPLYAFRAQTSGGDNAFTANNLPTTAPTTVAGDLEVMWATVAALSPASPAAFTTPAGWNVGGTSSVYPLVGGALNIQEYLFWRIAPGTGSAATLQTSPPTNSAMGYARKSYSNPDASSPFVQVSFGNLASSASLVVPSLTTTTNRALTDIFISQGAAQSITPPGTMTERVDNTTYGVSTADEQRAAAGATGTRTFTVPVATDSIWGYAEFRSASVHASTGALVGPGSVVAGTAARTRQHDASGVLIGQGSVVVGAGDHQAPAGIHDATGALVGQGSVVSGSAARKRTFASSGVLVGPGSVIAGAAARVAGSVSHDATGVLVGPGSVVSGSANRAGPAVSHNATGALVGQGSIVSGEARRGVAQQGGMGFELIDHPSSMWWKRKPKSLPVAVAGKKLKQVAKAIDELAAEKIEQDEPIKQRDVRDEIAPLLAEMPGFDWRPLFRAVVEYRQQEAARLEAMAQIERIRAIERDDDDVLALLMSF